MKNSTNKNTICPRCGGNNVKLITPNDYMLKAIIWGFFFLTLSFSIIRQIILLQFDIFNFLNCIIICCAVLLFFPFRKNLIEYNFMKKHKIKIYIRCFCCLDSIPIFDEP